MVQTEQTPITTFNTIKLQLNCNLRWNVYPNPTHIHYSDIPILMFCTHTQTLTQIITPEKWSHTFLYTFLRILNFTIHIKSFHFRICTIFHVFFLKTFRWDFFHLYSVYIPTLFFLFHCHLTPSMPYPIYLFARPIARFLSHSKQSHTHKKISNDIVIHQMVLLLYSFQFGFSFHSFLVDL